ncbi:hypothetical protein [Alistipes sp.]|uniref:hypothetical protein n=1 Tax=Alistipes sp. TaxID=1872444 RepID=UPI003AF015AF
MNISIRLFRCYFANTKIGHSSGIAKFGGHFFEAKGQRGKVKGEKLKVKGEKWVDPSSLTLRRDDVNHLLPRLRFAASGGRKTPVLRAAAGPRRFRAVSALPAGSAGMSGAVRSQRRA